jgi:methylated-DNA-[protein]-cysteine S-methyltransferase
MVDMNQAVLDIAIDSLDTQVGRLSLAVSELGLVAVRWGEPAELATRLDLAITADPSRTEPVVGQLAEYFMGRRQSFDVRLDWLLASPVQQAVLETLYTAVGFGQSITYGELAARSATHLPARGIGAIMGANPMPIVVPCHRVLAADGLGGYSGGARAAVESPTRPGSSPYGLETKRWLLTFEGVLPPTLGWDPDRRLDLDDNRPISG